MSNQKAQARYHEMRTKIEKQLKNIDQMIETHRMNAGDSLNWGHVGDLSDISGQLGEVIGWLGDGAKPVPDNGSDGVDDDPFVIWQSPQEAELYA